MKAMYVTMVETAPRIKGKWLQQMCGTVTVMRGPIFTNEDTPVPFKTLKRDRVVKLMKAFGYSWDREEHEKGNWYDVRLYSLENVDDGVWEYVILQEWQD